MLRVKDLSLQRVPNVRVVAAIQIPPSWFTIVVKPCLSGFILSPLPNQVMVVAVRAPRSRMHGFARSSCIPVAWLLTFRIMPPWIRFQSLPLFVDPAKFVVLFPAQMATGSTSVTGARAGSHHFCRW